MRDLYDYTVYQVKIAHPYTDSYDNLDDMDRLRKVTRGMGIDAQIVGSAASMTRVVFENQEDMNLFLLSSPNLKQTKYDKTK